MVLGKVARRRASSGMAQVTIGSSWNATARTQPMAARSAGVALRTWRSYAPDEEEVTVTGGSSGCGPCRGMATASPPAAPGYMGRSAYVPLNSAAAAPA
jgi:hypothetical protein